MPLTVANTAARLALTNPAQVIPGDVVYQGDGTSWLLRGTDPSQASSWQDRASNTGGGVSEAVLSAAIAAAAGGSKDYLRGLNITGLEGSNLDGTLAFGTAAQLPNVQATYTNAAARGHRLARIPFLWERVQPTVGGALSTASMNLLKAEIDMANAAGMRVALDLKNYGRRFINSGDASQVRLGEGVLTTAAFADLWSRIVTALADKPNIDSWGIMNEPHDLPVAPPSGGPSPSNTTWKVFSQAAVTAIRATGDTRDVWIHGDQFSGGWNWANYQGAPWITDPANAVVYVCHFYFNQTRSGIYDGTPYATEQTTAGINLVTRAIADAQNFLGWLKTNGVRGAVGEIGWPNTYDATSWAACADALYPLFNKAGVAVCMWGTGRNLTGAGPGGSYNQDPYPLGLNYAAQAQATVIERPENLSHTTAPSVLGLIEKAPNVRPGGLWDFPVTPRVNGVAIGGDTAPDYVVASGNWWTPTMAPTGTAALGTNATLGVAVLMPFRLPSALSIAELDVEITTAGAAGAQLRAAVYKTGADGLPDLSQVFDFGTIAATATGLGKFIPGTPKALPKGHLWFALAALTAFSTVRTVATGYNVPSSPIPAGIGPGAGTNIPIWNLGGVDGSNFPSSGALGQGTILMAPPKFWLKAA